MERKELAVRVLREMVDDYGPRGYAIACLLPGFVRDTEAVVEAMVENGVPVLAECEGPVGILRGLSVRMGPVRHMQENLPQKDDVAMGTVVKAYRCPQRGLTIDLYQIAAHITPEALAAS